MQKDSYDTSSQENTVTNGEIMVFSAIDIQDYFKEYFPHEAPEKHDVTKPFICVNCGLLCKNHAFRQEVMIKAPILFPDMFNHILDQVEAIYSSQPICFKGEISLP